MRRSQAETRSVDKKQNTVPLAFGNRVYHIAPGFRLVCSVEHELGGIVALRETFARHTWCVADLVTLTQMMLQSAGETVDYLLLGDAMLREGLMRYRAAAEVFLDMVLHAE